MLLCRVCEYLAMYQDEPMQRCSFTCRLILPKQYFLEAHIHRHTHTVTIKPMHIGMAFFANEKSHQLLVQHSKSVPLIIIVILSYDNYFVRLLH